MEPDPLFMNTTFVAFDIETTGLFPVADRIVEIGAVKFKADKVIATYQSFVDPEIPIPSYVSAINGITDQMVKGQPVIKKILPEFLDFLGDHVPIAHNAPFDVGFLAYDISRLNLKPPNKPVLDTCTIPKNIFPSAPNYKLGTLVNFLNIPKGTLHRALADAKACMGIFNRCILEMGGSRGITLNQILRLNGPPLCLNPGEIVLEADLLPLKNAIENRAEVNIRYQDANGIISSRKIIPLCIGQFRGNQILKAFCYLRNEERSFRLDRILEIGKTNMEPN